jgi:hypothetical protein
MLRGNHGLIMFVHKWHDEAVARTTKHERGMGGFPVASFNTKAFHATTFLEGKAAKHATNTCMTSQVTDWRLCQT